MLDHQLRLRNRAAKKFSSPDRWLWTTKLLEQSSDEKVASLTAAAFPKDVRVIDFCCGAGADAVALACRGPLTAVDRCDVACGLARANLALNFPGLARTMPPVGRTLRSSGHTVEVVQANAETIDFGSDTWVHFDPDRRVDSRRTTQVSHFQPGMDFLSKVVDRSAGGSIKLAPATKFDVAGTSRSDDQVSEFKIDRERMGRQFVAWGHSVRQQRWWWNVELYPAATTTVSILSRSGEWYHWSTNDHEASEFDEWSNTLEDWREIRGYIGDADSCVRAAGLQAILAGKLNACLVGNPVGFFQTEQLDDRATPLVDWFEIEATMAFDRKRLRSYLRERNVGVLEIKVRNVDIDPALLRNELKLRGSEAVTLLVTRCGLKTVAIVARRIAD